MECTPSSLSTQTQMPSISSPAERSTSFSTMTRWCLTTLGKAAFGAAAYAGMQAAWTRGKNLETLYHAVFCPEQLQFDLSRTKQVYRDMFRYSNNYSNDNVSPEIMHTVANAVDQSERPAQEYLKQINAALNTKFTCAELPRLGRESLPDPVVRRVLYQGLLQDVLLKHLVGRVLRKIAPQYTSVVDSKIYTTCRILVTAACAVAIEGHLDGGGWQVTAESLREIAFGILNETHGLAATLGAEAVNYLSTVYPAFRTC